MEDFLRDKDCDYEYEMEEDIKMPMMGMQYPKMSMMGMQYPKMPMMGMQYPQMPMMGMQQPKMSMMMPIMDQSDEYYDYMKNHCMYMAKCHEAHAYKYECMKYLNKMKKEKKK